MKRLMMVLVMALGMLFGGTAFAVGGLQALEDVAQRPTSSWQPGQLLLTFWLPDRPDIVVYVVNYEGNITTRKLSIWRNECENTLATRCRIMNIDYLDNLVQPMGTH